MKRAATVLRCEWGNSHPLYIDYHDKEWGILVHDDHALFELLCLEGAQAGLSWLTILKKRQNYREAFDNFDFEKVARYDKRKVERLLQDPGIVRNQLKAQAFVKNARAVAAVRDEFGSFDSYIWQFVGGRPQQNRWRSLREIPAHTPESDAMSKDLKKRGFAFVGTTICYAFMQACGMVNDHVVSCYRYKPISQMK